MIDVEPFHLLGRHVAWRSHQGAALGLFRVSSQQLGQPEVGDLGLTGRCQKDVGRLEVAMDDPALDGRAPRLWPGFRPARRHGLTRGAFPPGHARACLPKRTRAPGMAGRRARRSHGSGRCWGCWRRATSSASVRNRAAWRRSGVGAVEDHLERDRAVKRQVPGPVNHSHAAPTQYLLELITGNLHGPRQGFTPGCSARLAPSNGRAPSSANWTPRSSARWGNRATYSSRVGSRSPSRLRNSTSW